MLDRGFNVREELEMMAVKVNIPAFTRGRNQLEESEVTRTRRVASLRIHVERAINRIKTYRLLKGTLLIKHKKCLGVIVTVCAGVCNLKGPLIRDKD